jgi:hypothetical protein
VNTNIRTRPHTRSSDEPHERRSSLLNRLFIAILPLLDCCLHPLGSLLYTTIPLPETGRLYKPNHGEPQHLQQWTEHHTELPEHRELSAAFRTAGQLAYVCAMGRLHRRCPARQRLPARRRKGERAESTEHRRYVWNIPSLLKRFRGLISLQRASSSI